MPKTEIRVFRKENGDVPLTDWLNGLKATQPAAYAKCLERILQLEARGSELRRPHADVLRDGIRELRAKSGRVQYRMLYFFFGRNVAFLTHGFTKEKKVPAAEIEKAIERKRLVQKDPHKHTAEFEI